MNRQEENTSNILKPNSKEDSHPNSNDSAAVDTRRPSFTKSSSICPVQDAFLPLLVASSGLQENPSSSSSSQNIPANNSGLLESKLKLRNLSLASVAQKFSSTACANFYKLSTSELDSAEEFAPHAIVNEPSQGSFINNKLHLHPCANQRQPFGDNKINNICLKKQTELCDLQADTADKSKKLLTNFSSEVENRGNLYPSGLGWQATKPTVKQRLEYMCLNTYLADVYFIVVSYDGTTKEKIPAHKFILSISSPVFDAMFKFDDSQQEVMVGKEVNQQNIQEIELIDVERQALEALLTFLYTDYTSISPDCVMAILYTAKKYGVPALEQQCVDFLKENLNPENAFMLLSQARLFDEPQLTEMCLAIIDRDTSDAIQSKGFTDADHQTLCSVLKRDSLRIDELFLFQALVKWSLEECKRRDLPITPANQREVLGCIVSLVRYSQMSVQEFAEHVAMSKLLTDAELVNIFLYFTLDKVVPAVQSTLPIHFPVAPRGRFIGKEISINRFQRIEASWGYNGTPDRIKFTVDASIFVLGFGLYGSMNDTAEYSVTIEIINFGSGQILAHHETSFMADGTPSIFRVMFKEPVEIASGLTYIASAKLKGAESHYGAKGLRRIVRQLTPAPNRLSSSCLTDSAITFQFSYAAGNNNGTSVDDGQIPEIVFCQKF